MYFLEYFFSFKSFSGGESLLIRAAHFPHLIAVFFGTGPCFFLNRTVLIWNRSMLFLEQDVRALLEQDVRAILEQDLAFLEPDKKNSEKARPGSIKARPGSIKARPGSIKARSDKKKSLVRFQKKTHNKTKIF